MIIVTSANDNYAQHLGVMLTSLLENNKQSGHIDIYIIDGGISENNKTKLQRVVKNYDRNVTFLKVDRKLFESFTLNTNMNYVTIETYFRILIPSLLSEEITKALYLDCDIVVEQDIREFWNTDLSNDYAAAVDERYLLKKRQRRNLNQALSIPRDAYYFNAGVLLMNLKKWREAEISKQLLKFIEENPEKLRLMDQDALNVILHGKWINLDYKWNYTSLHHIKKPMENPAIIHFTGKEKPWNSNVPFKEKYEKYLRCSLWDKDV